MTEEAKDKDNIEEVKLEDQMDARYTLMQSAKIARRDGYDMLTWKHHPRIQEIRSKYKLRHDILDHIAAWVWTFKRL